ncbi:hypothetical protein SDC9_108663 [bioreactor metagenome]|uniref:Uncharacterized protein n=1 Tax=bioreactor metagenome TaxID=1076179 RepID=A0A645B8M5_9ZZZZ
MGIPLLVQYSPLSVSSAPTSTDSKKSYSAMKLQLMKKIVFFMAKKLIINIPKVQLLKRNSNATIGKNFLLQMFAPLTIILYFVSSTN